MDEKSAAAFNLWMDDFTNNPDAFANTTVNALRHLRERSDGREPTYGEEAATTYAAYMARVQ